MGKGRLAWELSGTCDTVITSMHAGKRSNIVIGQASAVGDWKEEYLDAFLYYLVADLKGSVETLDNESAVLHMEGVFAHAAMPYNGVNAALHLLNFIGCTYGDKFAHDTYHAEGLAGKTAGHRYRWCLHGLFDHEYRYCKH